MPLVLGRTEPPSDHGNGRNADSLLLTGYGAADRRSCMYWPTATARNPPGAAVPLLLGRVPGRGTGAAPGTGASPSPPPCSIGRSPWSRSGRRSRSARDARPQRHGRSRRKCSDGLSHSSNVCGPFCVSESRQSGAIGPWPRSWDETVDQTVAKGL